VVARALVLAREGTPLQLVLAPAYCMSLLHASRRGRIVAWTVVAGIATLVAIVSRMPQPWRGIVDAGVVAGLAIGLASLLWHAVRAMAGQPPTIAPDLPTEPVTPASDGSS
jgi:cytochrome bd-type quinol oxidase subunit 1